MLLLMQKLSSIEEIKNQFYLAGGTALALQCGHRKSEDLYFLTQTAFDVERLSQIMLSLQGRIISEEKETLHVVVNDTKLSFLYYPIHLC
jgi:ATP-dependent protease HslVU (ClpYQ) ATPase subunit